MNIPLNIDFQQILLHLFNFSLLAGGLYFLLYKPVKAFMDKRTAHYAEMEAQAADARRSADALLAAYQAKLDGAEAEISAMKAQAARDAEQKKAEAVRDAEAQKERILAQARESAGQERDALLQEAREEIIELAIAATAKMARGEK